MEILAKQNLFLAAVLESVSILWNKRESNKATRNTY